MRSEVQVLYRTPLTQLQKVHNRVARKVHSFRRDFTVHQVKSGLFTRVVQALGGWVTIAMFERYSKSLTFDDALQLYKQVNGGEVQV